MRRRTLTVSVAIALAVSGLAVTSLAKAGPAAAKDVVGSPCRKAGATMGIPNGTLVCAKSRKGLRWTRMGAAPGGARCPADPAAVFTKPMVRPQDLARITNGSETNDPRFAYGWVKAPYAPVPIYAPADGTLTAIRHLTRNAFFPSDDYQIVFEVPGGCDALFRFNHVTDPRADIKAAYQFGDQCSSCFDDNGQPTARFPEREVPGKAIAVKAGELLGYTSGTPSAHDFDIVIQYQGATLCPMAALPEPHRSALMALLGPGPKSGRPETGPVAGYPCTGYGDRL
ncbi:MAG: hypothetical protein KGP12_07605 [Actinomycetales bacterium]|nr:hypothetical protein [Actinomycetales bacterium]